MTSSDQLVRKTLDQGLVPVAPDELQPQCDLTFKVLDGLVLQGKNLYRSLLNGILVRNCRFEGVNFARCDLEQAQFTKCTFVDVNFQNIELTSAHINESRFENCRFDDALISDCSWIRAELEGCSFKKVALHNSKFEDCLLTSNELQGASVQLNIFRRTKFKNMVLGDCTFLNQILTECKYDCVKLNVEAIGAVFGLSETDLLSLGLVYLGQSILSIDAAHGLLNAMEEEFCRRRWFFARDVLRLNYHRVPVVVGVHACLDALLWPTSLGVPLKKSDIIFFEMMLSELASGHELPALNVLVIPEQIQAYFKTSDYGSNGDKRGGALDQLSNRLRMLIIEMAQDLKRTVDDLRVDITDQMVMVKLIFEQKPETDLAAFLLEISKSLSLPICGSTLLVRERSGSYEALMETTQRTLVSFWVTLWLLNGCVIQFTQLRARLQVAVKKGLPAAYRKQAELPKQDIPRWLAGHFQHLAQSLIKDPARLQRLASDFSPQNIKSIEVTKKRQVAKKSRRRAKST